ncbi:MAG: bifunctional nicotinamidase/pyrazinamidase [Candidatus Hodarchaeales archaeon]|jgi:nicotinamidase/pyrazinamidase
MNKTSDFDYSVDITDTTAFLVIDMQNDFLPGGRLAVTDGDTLVPGINEIGNRFTQNHQIVFTQDWHPLNHQSFASAHFGKKPFDTYSSPGLGPVLWPDHCVQGSVGADFAPGINQNLAKMILRKGYHERIDSYSAFLENDKRTKTGLKEYLKAFNVTRVFICGLALDYCVKYTAIDARNVGFDVFVILDLTKPVNTEESVIAEVLDNLESNQVHIIKSTQIKEEGK